MATNEDYLLSRQVSPPERVLGNSQICRGEETMISGIPESEVLSKIQPLPNSNFSGTGMTESVGSLQKIERFESEEAMENSIYWVFMLPEF